VRDQIFYANDGAGVVLDRHGDVHLSLLAASPVAHSASCAAVLPRRVAEELLRALGEALAPEEPEVERPEPLTGSRAWADERPTEVKAPWQAKFGVES
jgi:hypothetical protein